MVTFIARDTQFVCPNEFDMSPWDTKSVNAATNIYHISYTPATKEASLFFWGCNFDCRECLCKKEIRNYLLNENLHLFREEPKGLAKPPERFLSINEVLQILDSLELQTVLLEGQEASIDPQYSQLTKVLHEKFGSHNILCTNAYKIPSLSNTDELQISIKAYNDSLHRHYTGKSNERVLSNFISLYQSGIKLTVASLYIPDYIDSGEIERIAKFIASIDEDIPFHILAYFKAGDNPWRRPTTEEMEAAVMVARQHSTEVSCLTGNEQLKYEVIRIV